MRSLLFAMALSAAADAAAQVRQVRILALDKDSARVAVDLDAPGEVTIRHGEVPMEWTESTTSAPAERHDLRLSKLLPARQYFYQVEVDGAPASDVLTFRSGKSWVTRDATLIVTGDVPGGGDGSGAAVGEDRLADKVFAEASDLLILLGGDAGRPDDLRKLHGRSMSDRLVLSTGGPGETDPQPAVVYSDLAIAMLGDASLAPQDGVPAPPLAWASQSLGTVLGACWKVLATARVLEPGSPELAALRAEAERAGADVVLSRGAPSITAGPVLHVSVGDPDAGTPGPRHFARLRFVSGELEAALVDASGSVLATERTRKECRAPAYDLVKAPGTDFDAGEAGSSDVETDAAECPG